MLKNLARRLRSNLLPHIGTFARFQAGFSASEDFHLILEIFMDFIDFDKFHIFFVWIFLDSMLRNLARRGRSDLLAL